jgi:hypothetical protein
MCARRSAGSIDPGRRRLPDGRSEDVDFTARRDADHPGELPDGEQYLETGHRGSGRVTKRECGSGETRRRLCPDCGLRALSPRVPPGSGTPVFGCRVHVSSMGATRATRASIDITGLRRRLRHAPHWRGRRGDAPIRAWGDPQRGGATPHGLGLAPLAARTRQAAAVPRIRWLPPHVPRSIASPSAAARDNARAAGEHPRR